MFGLSYLLRRNGKTYFVFLFIFSAPDNTSAGCCTGYFASIFEDMQAGRDETKRLKGIGSIQNEETGRFALLDPIAILDAQGTGGISSD